MKRIKYQLLILPIISLILVLSSCDDWLDINTNQYTATKETEDMNPGYLFNYAAVTHSSNRQSGDGYIPLLIAGQGVADGGFAAYGGGWNEAMYDISTYSTGNTWVTAYANVGANLMQAIGFAENQKADNSIAQNKIMLAQVFFELTMMFGDVPCSQALGDYPTPAFDAQKDVLERVLTLADEAIALADPSKGKAITDYDIFYKGDMNKWIHLANSIKLRTLMVMVDKDPSKTAAIKTLIEAGNFLKKGENFAMPFFATAGNQNPQFRLNDAYADPPNYYMFYAHNSVLSLMLPNNDPRLPVYFIENVDGEYIGLETGEDAIFDDAKGGFVTSPINLNVWPATAADIMFSYQEVQFLIAEAYARGIGVAQDLAKAETYYKAGVEASLSFWGITAPVIANFTASLPALTGMSAQAALTAINAQQWVDFMTRPFEGWINQRRTLYPKLSVPKDAPYTDLMHRWIYPDRERQVNPNVPSPLPQITDKMWFEK